MSDVEITRKDTGEIMTEEETEAYLKGIRREKIDGLEKKYLNNNITRKELIDLMKIKNIAMHPKIQYESFYKVNMERRKPKELSDDAYGKFFRILDFISYSNKVVHNNGRTIKLLDLGKRLGYKSKRGIGKLINKLISVKMVGRYEIGDDVYLMINPIYANKMVRINSLTYDLFKEDIKPLLNDYQIKLLELEKQEGGIDSIKVI